jgi:hypothetical protein
VVKEPREEIVLMTTVEAAYEKATKLMRVKETVTDAQGNQPQVLNNPLEWWKLRCRELPTLAALARRALCVPATSAPSERYLVLRGLQSPTTALAYCLRTQLISSFFMMHGL